MADTVELAVEVVGCPTMYPLLGAGHPYPAMKIDDIYYPGDKWLPEAMERHALPARVKRLMSAVWDAETMQDCLASVKSLTDEVS